MEETEERSKTSVRIMNIWTKTEPRVSPPPRHNSPYWTRIPSLSKHHNHTQTHHIWWDSSGWVISPTKRHQPAHHTTFTRDKHSCLQWDLNPQPQQAISHRTMTWTTWWLGSAKPGHIKYQSQVPPFWPQQSETKVLKHQNFNQYRKLIKTVRPPQTHGYHQDLGQWVSRKFALKANVVTAVKCFSSQDRRIIFYLPASIPADHKEGVMDSVSLKNYYLSFWKQLFKHTYIMTITLNIIHIHIKDIQTHLHQDTYPQCYSHAHT
jgi:hypothetical protein